MKKELLGIISTFDLGVGFVGVVCGFIITFSNASTGWILIFTGAVLIINFYFLIWGVEDILKEEASGTQ